MSGFKVAVTVKRKNRLDPVWNKVHLWLDGDMGDLINLQKQLDLVKQDVNGDMNKKGLKLKDVTISIEFLPPQGSK